MPEINTAKWRAWASPLTAITFLAVAGTGIYLLADERAGPIRHLHEMAGILFVVAGVIHLIINWRAMLARFRSRVALAALAGAVALSLLLLLTPGQGRDGDEEHGGRRGRGEMRAGQVRD